MAILVHQWGFALALASLFAASLRVGAATGARGLALALAASAVFGTAAALWWLALGLLGLGSSALALLVAALASWVAARAWLPAPVLGLRAWIDSERGAVVVGVGALAGAALALLAWCLRYPPLGTDGVLYHLPESLAWLHGARPGSVVQSFYGVPVGNYPLAGEVIQGWGMALSRSFVPATLVMMWSLALLVGGGWVGLRALRVPPAASALAIGAIALGPLALGVVNFPSTDLPATAWLVVCAALVARAVRDQRAALLAPALLAGGLATGTKTTALPLTVLVLALGFYSLRSSLRPLARMLGVALVAAAVVGGTWYVRNLFQHGSPFWPLVAAPWGDPVPAAIKTFHASLLDRPRYTLSGHLGDYTEPLAGGVVLLLGVLVWPLIVRLRAVTAAAVVALLSVLVWANAPLTGRSSNPVYESIAAGTTRYLLPGLCAAALVTALAARRPGWIGRLALVALAAGAAWSLVNTARRGSPTVPSITTFVIGALAGALVALALRRAPLGRLAVVPLTVVAIVVAGLVLKPAADGFVGRFARIAPAYAPALAAFQAQPGYTHGSAPVSMAPVLFAPLAGDRLQHAVDLMPADISCAAVRQRMRDGWVVIANSVSQMTSGVYFNAGRCLAGVKPRFQAGSFTAYRDAVP